MADDPGRLTGGTAPCEHIWKTLARGRAVIRQCEICHEPDWDGLADMIDRRARSIIMAMAREVIDSTTL